MSSRFDICLLLYVIRLAGWLKHCNLSPSLSLFIGLREEAAPLDQERSRKVISNTVSLRSFLLYRVLGVKCFLQQCLPSADNRRRLILMPVA